MTKAPHSVGHVVQVGVRDLRNNLSRWLEAVGSGHEIVVTDRGRAVARLIGVNGESSYERLVAEGLIQPPRAVRTASGPRRRVAPSGGGVTDYVKEQRR